MMNRSTRQWEKAWVPERQVHWKRRRWLWSTLAPMPNPGRAVALRRHPTVQRLGRFALSAIAVQAVYATLMAIFLLGLMLPRQIALVIGYAGALVVHFTLNRQLVFAPSDGYVHGLSSHGRRYIVIAAVVYVVTALGLAWLPGAFGIAPYIAWLLITVVIGATNFVLLGRFVFR
jgi:putative flippase GtrA